MQRLLGLGLAATLAACGVSEGGGATGVVLRDSAGITIVESAPPREEWSLEEPPLRIGMLEGDPNLQFTIIPLAARLADGRVVVTNTAPREIRFFNPDGTFERSVGRSGGGPGEFEDFTALTVGPGDTTWIYDRRNARITAIGPDGVIAHQHSLLSLDLSTITFLAAAPGGAIISNRLYTPTPANTAGFAPGFWPLRDTVRISRIELPAADSFRPLARTLGVEWVLSARTESSPWRLNVPVWRYGYYADALGRGVVYGSSDQPELRIVDELGTLRRIIRLVDRPRADLASMMEGYFENQEERARTQGAADPSAASKDARAVFAAASADHLAPAFDRIKVDTEDRIWVRDYIHPDDLLGPQRWTILTAEGLPVATLTTPARFQPQHLSREHVSGMARDSLDVQSAVVYHIVQNQSATVP